MSNTDDFVKTVVDSLATSSNLDRQKLNNLTPGLEWLSRKLFGAKTATVVTRIIELEAEVTTKPHPGIVAFNLLADRRRINELTTEEQQVLAYLHDGLSAAIIDQPTPSTKPSDVPPSLGVTDDDKDLVAPLDISGTNKADSASTTSQSSRVAEPARAPEPPDNSVRPVTPAQPSRPVQAPQPANPPVAPSQPRPEPRPATPELSVNPIKELPGKNLDQELNADLLSQTGLNVTYSIPVETLREFLMAVGDVKITDNGNLTINGGEIVVTGLKVDAGMLGGKMTISLSIRNSRSGITGQIRSYEGRGGPVQGKVEERVAKLATGFKEKIDGLVAGKNPTWKSGQATIDGNRIILGFHKTNPTTKN